MKKIYLIEAINPKDVAMEHSMQNLGLGYLISYAKKYGGYKNIKILASGAEIDLKTPPDIVGISSVTQYFNIAIELAKNIREQYPKTTIVMGGVHASVLPATVPKEVDYIVVGEGEQTFLELLDFITKKKGKVEDIKGLYYKKNDDFVFNGPRELISPVDRIPYPYRDKEEIKNKSMRLFTSRGCPYHCPYCSASHFWKVIRFHSYEYVIGELNLLINRYHAKQISFSDDLFIANKPRLEKLASEIIKRGWNKKVSFQIQSRVNFITEDIIKILKSMNVVEITLGIETGSERMLKIIKNGTVTLKQNYDAVKIIRNSGIKAAGFFMIGYPGETVKDINASIRFIERSNIDSIGMAITMPFPGTPLWNDAVKKGQVSEDMDWAIFQTDFAHDINNALIISDINRKILFRKYKEFLEISLKKNLQNQRGLSGYFKRINFYYLMQLIKNPSKILFGMKILLIIIKKKLFEDASSNSKR